MKKINKVLILFLLFVVLVSAGIWKVLQSSYVATLVSSKITESLVAVFDTKVEFNRFSFKLFPPGITVEKMHIRNIHLLEDEKDNYELKVDEFDIIFDLVDILSNKISIKRIGLTKGELNFSQFSKKENKGDFFGDLSKFGREYGFKVSTLIKDFKEKMPVAVNSVTLNNILIKYQGMSYGELNLAAKVSNEKIAINWSSIIEDKLVELIQAPLDNISGALDILDDEIIVKNVFISNGTNYLNLNGSILGTIFLPKIWEMNLQTVGKIDLADVLNKIPEASLSEIKNSEVKFEVTIKEKFERPEVEASIILNNIKSDYVNLSRAELKASIQNNKVFLNSFFAESESQRASLSDKAEIYDFKVKKVAGKIDLDFENFKLNTGLYYLREDLDVLKGEINGGLEFRWSNENVSFLLKKDAFIKKLKVKESSAQQSSDLISLAKVVSNNFKVDYIFSPTKVIFNGGLMIGRDEMLISGGLDDLGIDIIAASDNLNLLNFKEISGISFEGEGKTNINVKGPWENIIFEFDIDHRNSKVIGLNLGSINSNLKLYLENDRFEITRLEGTYKDSSYKTKGFFDFAKTPRMDLALSFPKLSYLDFLEIFEIMLPDTTTWPKEIESLVIANALIRGELTEDSIVVKGSLIGKDVTFMGQNIDILKSDFFLRDGKLKFTDIEGQKNKGKVSGRVDVDLDKDEVTYQALVKSITLMDLDIYRKTSFDLNGIIDGTIQGQGTIDSPDVDLKLKLKDSISNGHQFDDSELIIEKTISHIKLSANFFKKFLKLDSILDLSESKNSAIKKSFFKIDLSVDDFEDVSSLLYRKILKKSKPEVRTKISLDSKFNFKNPFNMDGNLTVKDFYLRYQNQVLKMSSGTEAIKLKDGVINLWNFALNGSAGLITSKGRGDLSDSFQVENLFNLNMSMFEFLVQDIKSLNGKVSGLWNIGGQNKNVIYSGNLRGENINLNYAVLPGNFEDIDFYLRLGKDRWILESLTGYFARGRMEGHGTVLLEGLYPDLDLKLKVFDSNISVLNRSNLILSSDLSLIGKGPPYVLDGNIRLVDGNINDEITDLTFKKVAGDPFEKFLPKRDRLKSKKNLKLNILFKAPGTLYLKNTLAEMQYAGNLLLTGYPADPIISGKLAIVSGSSKVFFRNSDFDLRKGEITFVEDSYIRRPILDYLGTTKINDYDITLIVKGPLNNFTVSLVSDPFLSQADIVSLLALGYTQSSNTEIDDASQESLTSLGIGSFLFDQFKINQELKSSLGLEVSIAPEFIDADDSLLQGRSSNASSGTSKTKSATKLVVQKRLNKSLNLSLSNTLGATDEGKREMLLDYELNKSILLQGVYEQTEDADSDEADNPDSIGLDLKYKITF